ncbi:MAG TPA: diphthine--ammonia ligase [Bacteroidia bacterium]|jgi:uncharacterized protein (TIGR00290 family)|nr:diphthine--ammonia ligase [Bacteroidia bacterium]
MKTFGPPSKIKALFCWSGGKDSALCLYEVLQESEYDVKYLVTTVNENFNRVSIHGVREDLLEKQAAAIGIPLRKVYVNEGSNAEYERQMGLCFRQARAEGIEHVIFGDIFLEDLRVYREKQLATQGMKAVFPLWKQDTRKLISRFLELKFRTVICCVNDAWLGEDWVGKEIDSGTMLRMPEAVDACGENGEFHTFCFAGPLFKKEIKFVLGEKVYKQLLPDLKKDNVCGSEPLTKGFWYCDLISEPVSVI